MLMSIHYWMGIRQLLYSHLLVLSKDVPSPPAVRHLLE